MIVFGDVKNFKNFKLKIPLVEVKSDSLVMIILSLFTHMLYVISLLFR